MNLIFAFILNTVVEIAECFKRNHGMDIEFLEASDMYCFFPSVLFFGHTSLLRGPVRSFSTLYLQFIIGHPSLA